MSPSKFWTLLINYPLQGPDNLESEKEKKLVKWTDKESKFNKEKGTAPISKVNAY